MAQAQATLIALGATPHPGIAQSEAREAVLKKESLCAAAGTAVAQRDCESTSRGGRSTNGTRRPSCFSFDQNIKRKPTRVSIPMVS